MLNVTKPNYEVVEGAKVVGREFTDELQVLLGTLLGSGRPSEEIRVGSGWCTAYVEVRRERAYSFQVTIEERSEDRFGSRNLRRTPEGDVVRLVTLEVSANWSSLGTVAGADAQAFAERLSSVMAQVNTLFGIWLGGQQLAVVYATAAEEASQLADAAVSRLVKLAWESLPESKRNLKAPRTVTCADLADLAGRTFEVYVPSGKKGTCKAEVLVGVGGVCVVASPAPTKAENPAA